MRAEALAFEKASQAYERGRPGYPADTVEWIVRTAGLGPGRTVVDLAAGTGKLTTELLACGAKVVAVEPLAEMRARLAERLEGAGEGVAARAQVEIREGLAEDTGLEEASADAVTVAQAFHWFANERALAEIARVLVDEGLMILVWNRRDLSDRIQSAISRLTAPFVGDTPSHKSNEWRAAVEADERFGPAGEHSARLEQVVDRQGLVDRVASTSYIASLPDTVRLPLLDEVAALAGDGGDVRLPYLTTAYAYRRRRRDRR
ncbi:MAG TPA: class I SAM-dependent methyltransferase [Acidimicrobiales bacterium]|nr:class I SAM-dependent methyltransferase [Acidimicrobiales bacterium]